MVLIEIALGMALCGSRSGWVTEIKGSCVDGDGSAVAVGPQALIVGAKGADEKRRISK